MCSLIPRKQNLAGRIEHAKMHYLKALIDECNGDLSLIGHYWDHHSDKTLRALIQTYGLEDQLQAARNRGKSARPR